MGSWNLSLNVAGIAAYDPTKFANVPTDIYEVEITGSEEKEKDGKKRIEFEVSHLAGTPYAGATHKVFMHLDLTKMGNKSRWRALMENIAKDPANLEKGEISVSAEKFQGKRVTVYIKNNTVPGEVYPQGKQPFPDVDFVTKATAAELKKNIAVLAAQPPRVKPAGAGATATSSNGTNSTVPQPPMADLAAAAGATKPVADMDL